MFLAGEVQFPTKTSKSYFNGIYCILWKFGNRFIQKLNT